MNIIPEVKTQTMSSEDLFYMVCKARKEFSESIPRMNDFHNRVADELEGEYYESFVVQNPNKTESTFYWLTQEQCLLVGMRESKSVRRNVTKKIKELMTPALPNFNDPVASARAWADAKESEQKALQVIKEQAPKVEFVDKYVSSDTGNKGFRQVAKLLKVKENWFREFLIDNKIMYRLGGEWMPHQNHIDAGRFEVKAGTKNDHAYNTAKFTPKGVQWIAELMGEK